MSAQTLAAPAPSPTPSPIQRPDGPRRRVSPAVVLGVILTAQLMVVLDATIVNVALPRMQTALHFTPTGLSWVLNAYTLAFGGLLLFGARAGDLFGRRRVFLAGMALVRGGVLRRRPGHHLDLAGRVPRGSGCRRGPRRTGGARTAHVDVHRGARAHSRPGPVHRSLHRGRRHRPHRRRPAHAVVLVALGDVRQRPDRPRGDRRRAPGRPGDPASDRTDRRGRRPDLDPRHDRPRLRVRPRCRGRVEQRRDDHVVRRRGAAARGVRRRRTTRGTPDRAPRACSPTPPVRGRMPGGCFSWPGSWARSSSPPCSSRTCSTTARCRPAWGSCP
ncbi:MFS transporter [Nostocoides sp. HKS02]|nr:MFS transporter [Tetrasphaera sp. HKS02]